MWFVIFVVRNFGGFGNPAVGRFYLRVINVFSGLHCGEVRCQAFKAKIYATQLCGCARSELSFEYSFGLKTENAPQIIVLVVKLAANDENDE